MAQQHIQELATLINLVQNHPSAPDTFRDRITDALTESMQYIDLTGSAEGIALCLAGAAEADRRRHIQREEGSQ